MTKLSKIFLPTNTRLINRIGALCLQFCKFITKLKNIFAIEFLH